MVREGEVLFTLDSRAIEAQIKQQQMLGPSGSLAVTSLFGARGGMPGAGY